MSTDPASILGIPHGSLAVGAPADVAVFDPDRTWEISEQTGSSRNRRTHRSPGERSGDASRTPSREERSSLKRPRSAKVTLARKVSVSPTSFLFTFEAGPELSTAKPGQFVNVAVSGDLTLMRPFSVAGDPGAGQVRPSGGDAGEGDPRARGDAGGRVGGRGGTPGQRVHGAGQGHRGDTGRGRDRRRRPPPARAGARGAATTGYTLLSGRARPRDSCITCFRRRTGDGEMLLEVATDDGSAGLHGTVTALLDESARRVQDAGARLLLRPAGDDQRDGRPDRARAGDPVRSAPRGDDGLRRRGLPRDASC